MHNILLCRCFITTICYTKIELQCKNFPPNMNSTERSSAKLALDWTGCLTHSRADNMLGPVNSPRKWPVTQIFFHLMTSSWCQNLCFTPLTIIYDTRGITELMGKHDLPSKMLYKSYLSRQSNCWSLRRNWSIACRRSNYIVIPDLILGFNGIGKCNCKTRKETFKFGIWYRLY